MLVRKLLKWSGIALLVAVLVGAGLFFWLASSGRAQRDGRAELPGLAAPVDVRFDLKLQPAG